MNKKDREIKKKYKKKTSEVKRDRLKRTFEWNTCVREKRKWAKKKEERNESITFSYKGP